MTQVNLVFLGPPGAGKGTQAMQISQRYSIPHISTGDMLRLAIENQTSLGLEAQRYVNSGELVPDDVVIGLMIERLKENDCKNGYILDGFPRTVRQAIALDHVLLTHDQSLNCVLQMVVEDSLLVRRLSGRRTCTVCGKIHHIDYSPPSQDGVCDDCQGELFQREDDEVSTILSRLRTYHAQTEPLVSFYMDKGILKIIDGDNPVTEVTESIASIIDSSQESGV